MAGYGALANDIAGVFGLDEQGRVTPKVPNANQVTRNYLGMVRGYQQGAPLIYNTEAQYEPMYGRLGLQNLNQWLYGAEGAPGILQQIQGAAPVLGGVNAAANTQARTADMNDLATLGPGAMQAYRGMNPGGAGVMDLLNTQATEGLKAGASLDPSLKDVAEQSIRGGQAARGLGYGPADVMQESRALTSLGDSLRQERQGFGLNVSGANAGYQAPVLQMLMQQSAAPGQAAATVGAGQAQAQAAGPTLMSTKDQYDMYNTAYNARAAANIAGANNMAASDSAY